MKYIFITGAPGCKSSSVARNIYFSNSINRSDFKREYDYYKTIRGKTQLAHFGAYFDPTLEYGKNFDKFETFSKEDLEEEFDKPFTGNGIKIIKGHNFCHHLDFIKENWPDCPIVMCDRSDDSCFGWWLRCGGLNIAYPSFDRFPTQDDVVKAIDEQNADMRKFIKSSGALRIHDNMDLCEKIGITRPPMTPHNSTLLQNYSANDVEVYVSL